MTQSVSLVGSFQRKGRPSIQGHLELSCAGDVFWDEAGGKVTAAAVVGLYDGAGVILTSEANGWRFLTSTDECKRVGLVVQP